MRKPIILLAVVAGLVAVASPSFGDPWKDESGKGRRGWLGRPTPVGRSWGRRDALVGSRARLLGRPFQARKWRGVGWISW
jgi:hypothetical protein